ncbi:methyltransferase domain-containing protein [Mesorhizobium marinum]|uniref:methyltransferase domain-containing protein n=1 Tax=Mesorhizobium marinum TaxID=3228790 RepID=UPI00346683A4
MAPLDELRSYIIKGGEEGRARLSVLARVLAPTTATLLDRFEPLRGRLAIDAGCGGGDVSFEIAGRVGPTGRVVAFDLDETKLAAARDEAKRRGLGHVGFINGSVIEPWPARGASLAYVRFVLTHLAEPDALLRHALEALEPGGTIVVEDIDFGGLFCDPASEAFDRSNELYVAAARLRGGDAFIGRRLARLLEDAGFAGVGSSLVQPYGRSGDVKQISSLTFAAISDAVIASNLATAGEVAAIRMALQAFAARPDTTLSMPRIFQAWGNKP